MFNKYNYLETPSVALRTDAVQTGSTEMELALKVSFLEEVTVYLPMFFRKQRQ